MLSFFLVVLVVANGEPPEYCTIMSVRNYVKSWLHEQEPHRLTYQWTVLDECFHWNTMMREYDKDGNSHSRHWSCEAVREVFNGSHQSLFPLIRFPTEEKRDSFLATESLKLSFVDAGPSQARGAGVWKCATEVCT